jgi:hypothetical protein
VQPSKLLENLRVVGIAFKHATVGALRSFELLLLLVDVTDLEPNILFRERTRGVGDYVFEAVQTLVELLLLLVYYAQAEVDLVCLLEVGLHAHDLGKGLLRVLKGAVAVVQDTNAVPKFGFLGI